MIKLFVGNWEHLFEGDRSPRMTRILINQHRNELVAVQIQFNRSMEDSFLPANEVDALDVQDSLLNANNVYENPEEHGLEFVTELPSWAEPALKKYLGTVVPNISNPERHTLLCHLSQGFVMDSLSRGVEINISRERDGKVDAQYIRADGTTRPA